MPSRSPRSAGATYLDKDRRVAELRAAARRAAQRQPAIKRIILFGSLVSGRPTPRSDADLVVILAESSEPDPRRRMPEIQLAFRPLPCPLDITVVTEAEVAAHGRDWPVLRLALETGMELL